MAFGSQNEAKQFLADKVIDQAAYEGEPFSDPEKLLLMFSVDEPESASRVPEDLLEGENAEFEAKVTRLLKAAYRRDVADSQERQRYKDAMENLNGSDHYILVMANDALPRARMVRDVLLYIAIGLAVVGAVIALGMWSEAR